MISRTVLVGRLARDPELKYTANNVAFVNFTVAVNRQFTNSQGEREADFIGCIIWRKAAENFANFTKKGSLVGIDGRIQTRNYENKQGNRVYVTEVVADNFSLLESRSESEKRNSENTNPNQAPSYNNSNQSNQSPANNNSNNNFNGGNNAPANSGNYNSNTNNNNNNQSNNNNSSSADPFADNSKPMDISDDDLPF